MEAVKEASLLEYLVVPHTSKEVREWAFALGLSGATEMLLDLEKARRVVKYQPLTGAPTYRSATAVPAARRRPVNATPPRIDGELTGAADLDGDEPDDEEQPPAEPAPPPARDRMAEIAAAAKRHAPRAVPPPCEPARAPVEEEPMALDAKKWITTPEAAELLGITTTGVRKMFERGALGKEQTKAEGRGGATAYDRATVERVAKERSAGAVVPRSRKMVARTGGGKERAMPREKKPAAHTPSEARIVDRLRWEADGCARGFVTVEQLGQRVLELLTK